MRRVDLRSDTITRPTADMRRAMANAVVGDDCYGEDPTVAELERYGAELMGKEAAVFVASGTMGNACALMAHTRPGDAALLDAECHIYVYEQGGLAALCGLLPVFWDALNGCPSPEIVQSMIDRNPRQYPPLGVICLENTHNRRGGRVIRPDEMAAVRAVAQHAGVPLHLDGARIFNAATALSISPREIADQVDTVQFCLSKGLCAPVGSLLAGSHGFVERARRARKRLGGSMRQSGVIAAAGLVALRDMPSRLSEDHANARMLAQALSKLDPLGVDPDEFPTNIVILRTDALGITAHELASMLAKEGVLITVYGPKMARFVTNHDASTEDVEYAAEVAVRVCGDLLQRSPNSG
ncbi:threonine aldolase [Candidatus Poribacteria bacterium]|nr:threonine aldolase [Candidatus Poribacteria bacterium]